MPIPKTEMQWAQFMVGRCFEVLAKPVPFTVVSYHPATHAISLHTHGGRLTGYPISLVIDGLKKGLIEESELVAPFTTDAPATRYTPSGGSGPTRRPDVPSVRRRPVARRRA